jgi:hypothetical protein
VGSGFEVNSKVGVRLLKFGCVGTRILGSPAEGDGSHINQNGSGELSRGALVGATTTLGSAVASLSQYLPLLGSEGDV